MRVLAIAIALSAILAGCGAGTSADPSSIAEASPATLSGTVTVDGSSTVFPVSTAMATAFQRANGAVKLAVQESGTGGGFKKFCAGGVDVAGASRPINAAEIQECATSRVEFLELPVAFDSLSVVVNASNSFVQCLSVSELKRLWEPAAEGKVTRWNQIRSSFPAQPIALFGPGTESGTFDYFTLAIVGTQSRSRADYTKSEDDEVIAKGVASDPNALGYFGYAYYLEHKDVLKLVAVDNGHGCVAPNADTVLENTYQPLSRPIFIYLNKASAARPEVKAFARFYVDPANASRVQNVGYVPLPPVTLLAVGRRLESGTTGSIFGGQGSVLGLTAETFQDEDRIKNALVQ